jgi:hypothetical protein
MWISNILTAAGTSVITCFVMEAYHQRRAQEQVGDYDYAEEKR